MKPRRKGLVVYVSGPFTRGSQWANVRAAVRAGEMLRAEGHTPVIPHLYALLELVGTCADYEEYMRMDLALLDRCDAVLRLPGPSQGSDREVARAEERGIPVFYHLLDIA